MKRWCTGMRLRALAAALAGSVTAACAWGQHDGVWRPEEVYGPTIGMEADDTGGDSKEAETPAEISAWASLPADGPAGRPLPVAGSWMAEKMYGPAASVELIKQGHHMLITFLDPVHLARWEMAAEEGTPERVEEKFEQYYRPALEYAAKHHLPIAMRGWNWADQVAGIQDRREEFANEEIPPAEDVNMLLEGRAGRLVDPFGPIDQWREYGRIWFGTQLMRLIQEVYPDPPMVVYLNNNEGPQVRNAGQVPDDYPRFVEIHGTGPHSKHEKEVAIRESYQKRYAAMFEAARESLVEPAWKKNVRFVAYNNLWGTAYIGDGNRPSQGIWYEPDEGWLQWRMYDGGMPELYDNDWQPGKTDHTPNGMQAEAMNYQSAQPRIFQRAPDYYWSTIIWEGGRAGNVFRGRRNTSKPYQYITRGQQWGFDRYEGWAQFCLWTTRPRSMREFRWPPEDEHAYQEGTWRMLIRTVDRPWDNETLRDFWRFGKLVINPDQSHPFSPEGDQPQWLHELDRWGVLTCDANPPRDQWDHRTTLRVFALALVRGEAPRRRWLIYAHAPRGAVADATVELPGYGGVKLEAVPLSGSFFVANEADRSGKTLLAGGPAEIALDAGARRVAPGQSVRFDAAVTMPPGRPITGYTWLINGEPMASRDELAPWEHRFDEPGEYMVAVKAELKGAEDLVDQAPVFVGEAPDEAVVYDLSLDRPFAWEGPWNDSGAPEHKLVTYRHLPNGGIVPAPAVTGGRFVQDDQRGGVLQLEGGLDAIWLIRNKHTVMDREGQANKTISLWFRPDATEGRQVLYAQGFHAAGLNIYLDGDTLYAGGWAPAEGMDATGWYPVWGRNWKGDWISHEGIQAGQWRHVALVIEGATDTVQADKMHLYVDGQWVGNAPAARIPRQYIVPRVGRAHINGKLLTLFHDGGKEAQPFRGRIDDFRLVNAAETPE